MTALTERMRQEFDAARYLLRPDPGRTSIIAADVVQALLVDLRHFCDGRGIDFERCDRTAASSYAHERRRS